MTLQGVGSVVWGLDELIGKTEKLESMLKDGPGMDVMKGFGFAALEDIEIRFGTEGYGTWQPLSPVTVQKKGHATILIDTSNMKQSIGIADLTETIVRVTVPYGGKDYDEKVPIRHQLGITDQLPQRKIVEVTDHLLERLRPIYKEWYNSWRT